MYGVLPTFDFHMGNKLTTISEVDITVKKIKMRIVII